MSNREAADPERDRLDASHGDTSGWKRWGPYMAERAWASVREDYSPDGSAWDYFPHELARSKAYRWGEDGIAGICDRYQVLCLAPAFWNEKDPILKERLFGVTGSEGNHGEDVKEYYFHLDNTPTHSYMRYLYKYPHAEFPYRQLVDSNRARQGTGPEFELLDTGIFDGDHYVDVEVEYAKQGPEDIAIRIHLHNRSPDQIGRLDVLPTLWFRNTWSWQRQDGSRPPGRKPRLRWQRQGSDQVSEHCRIRASFNDPALVQAWGFQPEYTLLAEAAQAVLVTDNDTNRARFGWGTNPSPYVKDGFHAHLIHGRADAVNPAGIGTKAAPHYRLELQPQERRTLRLRLVGHGADAEPCTESNPLGTALDALVALRRQEADAFYAAITPLRQLSVDQRAIQRQAFAGLLWSKQFYHLVIQDWLDGDPAGPKPPPQRRQIRNGEWIHLYNEDIISMPDKWEYPWYAAWDCPRTSGTSATPTPRCTLGRRCGSSRSPGPRTTTSSPSCSRCCS